MALSCVYLATDVYLVCLQHALSTEKEEVMGLLIGEIDSEQGAHIHAVVMLRRSDKRKDRVEISPEQLTNATLQADRLTLEVGRTMRVLGWYHSHPFFTVWPSHVDIRTQAMYQTMDAGFVGIIISVFSEDKVSKEQQVKITCFQASNLDSIGESSENFSVEIPLHIQPTCYLSKPCLQSMVELPEILFQEEKDSFAAAERQSFPSILSKLNNNAVFTQALCHITEVVSGPLVTALEQRKANLQKRWLELLDERMKLLAREHKR